jgi:uncharacterized membrane protein YqjE
MEQTINKAEELAQTVKEYVNNRTDQLKLNAAEKTAVLVSVLIAAGIAAIFFVFAVLFLAMALSVYMSEVLGAPYYGFLFTAGVIFIIGLIVWIFRKKIIQYPMMNALLKHLFAPEKEEDNDEEDSI